MEDPNKIRKNLIVLYVIATILLVIYAIVISSTVVGIK